MLGLLLVSLAASAPAAPIAPVPVPPRPPVIVVPPSRSFSNRPGVTQTIAVQVRQDGRVLWAGDLMRSSKGMASFSQQLRESQACTVTDNGRAISNEFLANGLNVSIAPDYVTMMDGTPDDDRVQVSVERTRPYGDDGGVCDSRQGSTSVVRFNVATRLEHGRAVTLTGEAGLSVVLTLR